MSYPENNRPQDFPPLSAGPKNVRPETELTEYNVFAIISVCFGILGLVMLQIAFAPLAIVFGALGVHASRKTQTDTRKLAVTGYVLGIVDGIIWLILASVFHVTFFPL
jgi:hypothetical protein